MPRPGFYNDNEYRAYPFVDKQVETISSLSNFPTTGDSSKLYTAMDTGLKYFWTGTVYAQLLPGAFALPTACIVDAGFIMGLDAYFDDATHTVWLSAINKNGTTLEFVFRTNATPATLSFFRDVNSGEWLNEYAESVRDLNNPCAEEPIWSGFIVTSRLDGLADAAPQTFQPNYYRIEPGVIQNLNKAYLRSISVANYDRIRIPECDTVVDNSNRPIILNARCMKGDIRLLEGYNCLISQTDRSRTLTVTASSGAGAGNTSAELCEHGSELPLFVGEPLADNSKFYSGGPACDELIGTINGVGGPNVNIVGGANVGITVETAQDGSLFIRVQKKPNIQGSCTQ